MSLLQYKRPASGVLVVRLDVEKLSCGTETERQSPRRNDGRSHLLSDESASDADGGAVPKDLGTLIINVWREAEHSQPLRARLIARSEDESEATTSYAAGLEAVLAEVTEWFQGLAEAQ